MADRVHELAPELIGELAGGGRLHVALDAEEKAEAKARLARGVAAEELLPRIIDEARSEADSLAIKPDQLAAVVNQNGL